VIKKTLSVCAIVGWLAMSGFALQHDIPSGPPPKASKKGPVKVFTGEISDGQCAKNGSHDAIMKKVSINTAANCTKGCARKHEYVLFDSAHKKIYRLDDQDGPGKFAAQKVKITGNLDGEVIHVVKMEAAK
jgi:hypothetical protein